MSTINKAKSTNSKQNIIFVRKDEFKQVNKSITSQPRFFITSPVKSANIGNTDVMVKNSNNVVIKKISKIISPTETSVKKTSGASSPNSEKPKIHCRLCDRNITGQTCQLLFDHKENAETRLGRKFNIILNSSINYSYLSNYCCSSCTSKIQTCFRLLVEIQASDEVIRQTYEHSEGAVVNTSTQTFLCEECKVTLTGIKKFIRHYESHIMKKTIVGSKKDLKIMDIVPIGNKQEENQNAENATLNEDSNNLKIGSSSKAQIIEKSNCNSLPKKPSFDDNNVDMDEINEDTLSESYVNDDKDFIEADELHLRDKTDQDEMEEDEDEVEDDESVNIEKAIIENELTEQDLNEDNEEISIDYDQTIETLDDSEKEATSDAESTDTDESYHNLVEIVNNELNKNSDDEDDNNGNEKGKKGTYVCDTCNATFEYKFLLIHHFMKDHNWLKVFGNSKKDKEEDLKEDDNLLKNCRYCKENFEGPEFRKHLMICKQRFFEDRDILCPDCGKMFTYKKWLNHRRHHEALPHPDGWPCDLCGQRFRAKRFLKSHLAKHDESKKKICEICGKKLLPLSFFSHMLKHREKKHVCPHCKKAFTYQYSLRIHLRVHETDTRIGKPLRKQKIVCWFCKKEFDGIDTLNEHLKQVHNAQGTQEDSRFPCSKCEKRFPDMFSLKAHLKLIHEIKDEEIADLKSLPVYRCIECNICNQVFNSENKVKIHLKKEHGLKPFEMEILKKECEKCGKKFASKQNLIHHINAAHLHIKPMTCDICQEKFAKHSSLIYHKLRHSGEKPFQCEFCLKSYRQRNDVIRHLARHVRDKELSLEEASAVNNSPSPLVMKRRIFLKDSSINYQSVVRKSKRKVETIKVENVQVGEEQEPIQMEGDIITEEGETIQFEESQEGEINFVTDQVQLEEIDPKVEYDDATAESMVYVEEVATDDFTQDPNVQYVTVEEMYDESKNTIILSSPDVKNSIKNVTYRFVPSQLKYIPAVIVKKEETL